MARIGDLDTIQGNKNTKVVGTDPNTGKTVNINFDFGNVEEAPEDGTPYSRQDGGWVATPNGNVEEAPEDGTPYSRQDGGWVATPNGDVEEAPNDGNKYVRQSENWSELEEVDSELSLGSTIVSSTTLVPSQLSGLNEVSGTSADVEITVNAVTATDFPIGSVVMFKRTSNDYNVKIVQGTGTSVTEGRTYKDGDVINLWHKSLNVWEILDPPTPFEVVTQSEYDSLTPESDVIYFITA